MASERMLPWTPAMVAALCAAALQGPAHAAGGQFDRPLLVVDANEVIVGRQGRSTQLGMCAMRIFGQSPKPVCLPVSEAQGTNGLQFFTWWFRVEFESPDCTGQAYLTNPLAGLATAVLVRTANKGLAVMFADDTAPKTLNSQSQWYSGEDVVECRSSPPSPTTGYPVKATVDVTGRWTLPLHFK